MDINSTLLRVYAYKKKTYKLIGIDFKEAESQIILNL